MKKKLLVGCISFLLVLSICLYFYISGNNANKVVLENEEIKQVVNTNALTMMYETEANSGEYAVSSDTSWPQEGYTFNEQLSSCENGGTLLWNGETNRIIMQNNISDRCYVYFDKVPPTPKSSDEMVDYLGFNAETDMPDFSNSSCTSGCDESTVGLYSTIDDLGTTYYFRGNVDNNYVLFADYYWRIIRINGDGTIRLIYHGTSAYPNNTITKEKSIGDYSYNVSSSDNAFMGYMYGMTDTWIDGGRSSNRTNLTMGQYYYGTEYTFDSAEGKYQLSGDVILSDWNANMVGKYTCRSKNSTHQCTYVDYVDSYIDETRGYIYRVSATGLGLTTYETTHENINSSIAKTVLDSWYEENILNKGYSEMVADAIYCNDRSMYSGNGVGKESTNYSASHRLVVNYNPSLLCTNQNDRFSVADNIGNVIVNGDLTYPIALITADELSYAGYKVFSANNNSNYLNMGYSFWTMTPGNFFETDASLFSLLSSGTINSGGSPDNNEYAIRPVISLRNDLVLKSGDGTRNKPFQFSLG